MWAGWKISRRHKLIFSKFKSKVRAENKERGVSMLCSLSKDELTKYVGKQLVNLFPDTQEFVCEGGADMRRAMDMALERTERCFSHIKVRGYREGNQVRFYHLHSDQYATFLWFLANSLWKISGNQPSSLQLCDKLILLNKTLHGFWVSYKNCLPDIFLLSHPVGTVLGNANYSDGLVVMQNVTVNTGSGDWTKSVHLGRGLLLSAGAAIIGDVSVGDRCSIGIGCTVYKQNLPDDSVAYRDRNGVFSVKRLKPDEMCVASRVFDFEM